MFLVYPKQKQRYLEHRQYVKCTPQVGELLILLNSVFRKVLTKLINEVVKNLGANTSGKNIINMEKVPLG